MALAQSCAAGLLAALAITSCAIAGPRVYSLDPCADQFAIALASRNEIAGLSRRADDADSYLARETRGLALRRATLESILAARPALVIRYWGGDQRLNAALQRRGNRVVTLSEAQDFAGVRNNVRLAADAMQRQETGETLIARMDGQLAAGHGAWSGRPGLYLTSGGYTAGPGTLIDAMIRSAGMTNLTRSPGFSSVSLESLALFPPVAIIQAFFDQSTRATQHWGPGRHQIISRLVHERSVALVPASVLACPAWFAADGVSVLATAARH